MERPKVGYVPYNDKLLNKAFKYNNYINNAEIMIMEKNLEDKKLYKHKNIDRFSAVYEAESP